MKKDQDDVIAFSLSEMAFMLLFAVTILVSCHVLYVVILLDLLQKMAYISLTQKGGMSCHGSNTK